MNLECCISIKATKYIHKYVFKGHDRSTLSVEDQNDEIKLHLDSRYISACEAAWRLFRFKMHEEHPNVVRLQVHLPDEQSVIFDTDDDPQEVLDRAATKDTTLTAYFKANATLGRVAQTLLYQQFPQEFVWIKKDTKWQLRRRGGFSIGRMYFAGPAAGERFYLRTLLTVVPGATSFEDLRTVDGVVCPTFQAACLARGLLEDDNEWELCLEEAAVMQTGHQLRQLFATILKENSPLRDPVALWDRFKQNICDDVRHKLINKGFPNPSEEQIYDIAFIFLTCS